MDGLPYNGRVLALQFIPFLLIFLIITLVTARRNAFLVLGRVCTERQVQTHSLMSRDGACVCAAPIGAASAPAGSVAGLSSLVQLPLPHGSGF